MQGLATSSLLKYGGKIPIKILQLFLCHAVHCITDYEGQSVCLTCPVHNLPSL